jgi:hypothetical protein
VAYGCPGAELEFMIIPQSGRWQLHDRRGQRIGCFRSLGDTLEAICPIPRLCVRASMQDGRR